MDVIILDMGDDLKGESSVPGYENKIELLAFSRGVPDRLDHQDFTFTKYRDASSPALNQASYEGKYFPKVDVIIGRNDSGRVVELMRYTMKNVLIASITVGGGGGDNPIETIRLNYNEIKETFNRGGDR